MTNRIDRFIEALFRKSADDLVFGTGTPVRLRTNGNERVILDKHVRTEQIVKLLKPIAGSAASDLSRDGETCFVYESPAGRVSVKATTRGDRMMAIVLPAPTTGGDDVAVPIRRPSSAEPVDEGALELGALVDSAVDMAAEIQKLTAPDAPLAPLETPEEPAVDAVPMDAAINRLMQEAAAAMAEITDESSLASVDEPEEEEERQTESAPESVTDSGAQPVAPTKSRKGPRVSPSPPPVRPKRAGSVDPAINAVLRALVDAGGSDLHLTSGQRPMVRKDGDIGPLDGWNEPLTSDGIDDWMRGVAHEQAQETFGETNDADFAHEIPGVARFRMNWFRDRNGVGAVMRTIPSKVLTADQLDLPPAIRKLCELPKGLVVVTGPTGSGKSTTLAAMIDLINKTRSDHIITIEDPVEFVHQSIKCLVNQREVHTHTSSFSAALRAALREDPDIVLVGEMRDLETVHIAIETAETGHLVFGTLHTNTAASTVDRMIDQFPTDHQAQIRVMLSESLRGVVAQTLCKKVGGGRVACMEILIVNNAISNLVREGKTFQIPSIMQTNRGIGMQTQTDHMLSLVQKKLVDPEEAIRKAVDPALMKQVLSRNGFPVDENR